MAAEPPTVFGNPVAPALIRRAERLVRKYTRKYQFSPEARYPLSVTDTPVLGEALGVRTVTGDGTGDPLDSANGMLIGTIRMGYGHYRIGIALASAARALGYQPYWFDLLGFDAPGSRLIRDLDGWYSFGSRLSQRSRLFNRLVWEPLTGNAYRPAEKNYPVMETCRLFADVLGEIPAAMPMIGTHPWLALAARHAGLKRVVNAVPDNWPLGFHLAPGALHAVQSPSAYTRFRALEGMVTPSADAQCMPPKDIAVAGHFVDHELVANIEADCTARLDRLSRGAPRRLLISIGGAGAQQELLIGLLRTLAPAIQADRATMLINFGDHATAYDRFRAVLPELFARAVLRTNWPETAAFSAAARAGDVCGVHTFLHADIFAAVYTTNTLMRAADVLVTKPSELAFYPVPKVLLPRVGGHEAWGAIRAAELGDGTFEAASLDSAARLLRLVVDETDLIAMQCTCIQRAHEQGLYNGAYRAVEWGWGATPPGSTPHPTPSERS